MKREALAEVAADIVISYVSNRKVPVSDMRILIVGVCGALIALRPPIAPATAPRHWGWKYSLAVRKSVRPDAITCLACGKRFRSLSQHVRPKHGLSPQQYRERFNLSDAHPMEAAAYSKVRSDIAKARGLGTSIGRTDRPPADPDRPRRKRREGG